MEKNHPKFAFEWASKKETNARKADSGKPKWQPRDGVAVAGCPRSERWDVRARDMLGSDTDISC